jgi:hypothetical protein
MFDIGFSKESFLSNDKNEMGNIGTDDPESQFDYLLESSTTVREKTNAILNTFFDSINKRPKENSISLINYIFTNPTKWNQMRIEQLMLITNKQTKDSCYEYIFKNKLFDLWAPIIYIYPQFVFKRQITRTMKKPSDCRFNISELLEPLSSKEINFYGNEIEFHTGKCYYKDFINLLQNEFCSVAGLSGHTLLLLELANVLGIDWKPMVLCALFTNVPDHHSIDEVIRCVKIMNLEKNIDNNIDFINTIISNLDASYLGSGGKFNIHRKCKTCNKRTKKSRKNNRRTKRRKMY